MKDTRRLSLLLGLWEIEFNLELYTMIRGNISVVQITPSTSSVYIAMSVCVSLCLCVCAQRHRFKIHRNGQTILHLFAYLLRVYIKHDGAALSAAHVFQHNFRSKLHQSVDVNNRDVPVV